MSYHDPVLLKESIEALAVQRDGVYIDATFGGEDIAASSWSA